MKPFDTDRTPWLFTPHDDGELDEFFSSDHSKVIAETSQEVIASLSESRDRLSGKALLHLQLQSAQIQKYSPEICGYDRPCRCDGKKAEKPYHRA